MKNQNSKLFSPGGSDLASRSAACILRLEVEGAVAKGKIAVIDLTNVISISESYADELFAVLIEQHGFEWFSNNIELKRQQNSNQVLLSIARAIRHRLENPENLAIKSSIDGLIAAKKSKKLESVNHQNF